MTASDIPAVTISARKGVKVKSKWVWSTILSVLASTFHVPSMAADYCTTGFPYGPDKFVEKLFLVADGAGENRWEWCLDSSLFRLRIGTGAIRMRASSARS